MFRVFADNHHFAVSLDDLALFADGFDGRSDLHDFYLLKISALLGAPCDTTLCQVVGRHLNRHFIAGQNPYEIHAQLAGNMGLDLMSVLEFHNEGRVGKHFLDDAFEFQYIFF